METKTVSRTWQERLLCFLLRWVGGVSLLALIPVFMPHTWMNDIHRSLGMGQLPALPIIGYLTRSLSLFYALMGGLLIFCSFDPHKYRSVIYYLAWTSIPFGLVMLGIDYAVGMPDYWRHLEGPFVIILGLLIVALLFNVKPSDSV